MWTYCILFKFYCTLTDDIILIYTLVFIKWLGDIDIEIQKQNNNKTNKY